MDKNSNDSNQPQKKAPIAHLIIGLICAVISAIFLYYRAYEEFVAALFMFPFFATAIVLLLVCFVRWQEYREPKTATGIAIQKLRLPIVALGLDLFAAPIFALAAFLGWDGVCFHLISFVMPFAAIIIAAVALGDRKEIGKTGIGMSIAAILLPVVYIFIIIVLFSAGVLVISFM